MNITDQLAQALEACHPSKVWEMARMYYTNTVSREDPYIQWHEDRCRQVGVALSAYRASKEGEKWQDETAQQAADNYKVASESGSLPQVS